MNPRRKLPRVVTVIALSSAGCSAPPTGATDSGETDAGQLVAGHDGGRDAGFDGGGTDGGPDAGCILPSDFPPDAGGLAEEICNCRPSVNYHCYVEGGPRCASWSCVILKSADGGFQPEGDGGYTCLC